MKRLMHIVLVILLLLGAVVDAGQKPFDVIQAAYSPFMDPADPLGFPMKVEALSGGSYKFWRGTKDLFFDWCKTHAPDWNEAQDNWITSHGDIHFGNIGSYPITPLGQLGFGLVDFDESCRTPIQLELMQGIITVHLTARSNQLLLTEEQRIELGNILFDAYRQALTSDRNAMQLLANEAPVQSLLADAGKDYAKRELSKIAPNGRFVPATFWKNGELKGQVKDIYRPAMSRADDFAAGIEQAMGKAPVMTSLFRLHDRASIRASIKDAVQRTRVGSSGSQGLKKYLVLLTRPLKNVDHDLVIYLKQQIPSAAERAGLMPGRVGSPGRRLVEDSAGLLDPAPLLSSWCDIGNESYWLTFKEPWSEELAPEFFPEYDDLKRAAKIWGVVAGASHRKDPRARALAARLTSEQSRLIRQRCHAYLQQLELDYTDFTRDPRAAEARARARLEIIRLTPRKPD